MKILKLFFVSIISLLFCSCNHSWTFEIDPITHDTINTRNEWGRQGRWIINNCCAYNLPHPQRNLPDSLLNQDRTTTTKPQITLTTTTMPGVMEIGNYVNNKKQGLWTYYDRNDSVIKTQEFKDDLPVRD